MAEGYTSWTCADLGGATIYSSDYILNPDWNNLFVGYVCPLVHPVGFNILDYFKADIDNAISTLTAWDSGMLAIGRAVYNTPRNQWLLIKITVDPANGYIYVDYGFGTSKTSFYASSRATITISSLSSLPDYDKCFYVLRFRQRVSYHYANIGQYTGAVRFWISFGHVDYYKGVWESPTQSYEYGRMVYSYLDSGDPATCLLSFPCADDNQQSRMQQSSVVFRSTTGVIHNPMMGDDPYNIGDEDGYYNDNPEPPSQPDPNDEDPGGNSGPGGGDGDHRQPYFPIPIPDTPVIGPNSAGFVFMLKMTVAQMNQFATDLVRPSWWTVIKNWFADPLDFICGIMIVPYEPYSYQNVYPKFGDNVFDHAYPLVNNQYKEIDCGRLAVPKYFGSFLDGNPYTELLLWLPYIGYRKLDPDECVGKTLHIVYKCDCLTGDCVCFITTEAGNPPLIRVIAQYSGNCGVRVPFGAASFDAAISASIALLGGAVGAIATGGATIAGFAASNITASQVASSIAGSTIAAVNGAKTTAERSGTAGASAGYLSVQYPYLFRTVPHQSLPENYKDLEGYPSNIAGPLSKFSGYVAVESIDLNGIQATKEELNEIKSMLIGGVYI